MMANPFFVQPAQFGQGLQSLAGSVQQFGQQRQAQQAAEEQKAYEQQAKQAMAEAFQSGDPAAIRNAVIQFPEIGETAKQLFGFTNDQTEQVARETYRMALSETDPQRKAAILQGGIETVSQLGGQPRMMMRDLQMLQENPEAFDRSARAGYAALASDQEYEAMFGGEQGGPEIGKYNPRDYTADSFARFIETNDPSVLERYAAQRSVDIGGVPHVFDPAIGGYRPAVVSGGAKAERPRPVATEDVARSEAEIAAERERQVTRARGEEQAQSPEAQAERQQAIRQSEDTLRVVDQLLEADLGAITGVSARVPTVRPESMDLVRAAERLEALLTTENLGIMTGVLTDRDIELIKNIGSGLRVTEGGIQMSEEGARERLRQIRDTIEKKLSSARGRQRSQQETGQGGGSDIEALINKYAD